MTKLRDINDDEIRVIGSDSGSPKKRLPWWIWLIAGIVVVAIATIMIVHPSGNDDKPTIVPLAFIPESDCNYNIWHSNNISNLPSHTSVADTLIDSLHLHILTPYNAIAELHIGHLDTTDTDIILTSMAADLRRDNRKIVGAFVYAGEPISWGLSKKGYCAIIDDKITIGVAENTPLFEEATERGGYFFRQYPAVSNHTAEQNNPQNAAFRRALCILNNKVCIVTCTDRATMNDFNATLVKLGVSDAILLIGGFADGWYRDQEGTKIRIGDPVTKELKYLNYIVFRKQ